MFSQYSWWDFIKFVLILLVPYYGYVLIKYYREDIREWISNRGQPQPKPQVEEPEEEQELSPSRLSIRDYSQSEPLPTSSEPPVAQWLPEPFSIDAIDEVELEGPPVASQPDAVFGLPVMISADNADEQPIDEIISAAGRIKANEQGVLSPIDADDVPAAKLATAINNQQGREAFSDFNFFR